MTIKIAPVANTMQDNPDKVRLGGESPSFGPVRAPAK